MTEEWLLPFKNPETELREILRKFDKKSSLVWNWTDMLSVVMLPAVSHFLKVSGDTCISVIEQNRSDFTRAVCVEKNLRGGAKMIGLTSVGIVKLCSHLKDRSKRAEKVWLQSTHPELDIQPEEDEVLEAEEQSEVREAVSPQLPVQGEAKQLPVQKEPKDQKEGSTRKEGTPRERKASAKLSQVFLRMGPLQLEVRNPDEEVSEKVRGLLWKMI